MNNFLPQYDESADFQCIFDFRRLVQFSYPNNKLVVWRSSTYEYPCQKVSIVLQICHLDNR